MCVYSMVIDTMVPRFPDWVQPPPAEDAPLVFPTVLPNTEVGELKKQIAEFREALRAAQKVDRLTGQPDCEDPEKVKFLKRLRKVEESLGLRVYRVKNRKSGLYMAVYGPEKATWAGTSHAASRFGTKFQAIQARNEWAARLGVQEPRTWAAITSVLTY